jgi:hypothetical protein
MYLSDLMTAIAFHHLYFIGGPTVEGTTFLFKFYIVSSKFIF